MQVEWKWSSGISTDDFKHKFYTAQNLQEEALLPPPQYILCLSMGTTSKCHFSFGLPSGNPKIRTLTVSKFWLLISFSNQVVLRMQGKHLIVLKRSFQRCITRPNQISFDLCFLITFALSFDHNSCKLGINEQCNDTLSIYTSKPF